MLYTTLSILQEELDRFIRQQDSAATQSQVSLGNIALFETEHGDDLEEQVVMTVVNIQEEESLRNNPAVRKQVAGNLEVFHPPLYLNLYLLFAANWPEDYVAATKRLGQVMQFFQHRRRFTVQNSPIMASALRQEGTTVKDMKLFVDLQTLTFEQVNHLWGALGGKQLPSALYRVRCTEVEYQQPQGTGAAITEIQGKL